jgi:hypothetical protein
MNYIKNELNIPAKDFIYQSNHTLLLLLKCYEKEENYTNCIEIKRILDNRKKANLNL